MNTSASGRAAPEAYRYTGKSSLFLKAADCYDRRLDESDWAQPAFNDVDWRSAIPLRRQDVWGPLQPRTIPLFQGEPVQPKTVLRVLPLKRQEQWYSFEVPLPHVNEIHEPDSVSKFSAVTTWIYSPADQTVTAGAYYQDIWLNGVKAEGSYEPPDKGMRMNVRLTLRKGWNHYFSVADARQDILYHYMALPADGGLVVCADRRKDSPVVFRRTPVLTLEQYEQFIRSKPVPYAENETLIEVGGWVEAAAADAGQSPVVETSWDTYGESFETLQPEALEGRSFRLQDYPHGFAILLDLGMTKLVHPHLIFSGAGGTTIDLTYSEHLMCDGVHLRHQSWYGLGDRAIASESESVLDWRLTQPRGFRFVKLTVRHPAADIKLERFTLHSASYPVKLRGSFHCSDPLLNEIWTICANTQEANMEDAYVDCVTRERGQYIRDTIIQYHNNLALYGDQALMRRCMELVGHSADDTGKYRAVYPNTGDYTIADFSLNALEGFAAYYRNTGDAELIRDIWPGVLRDLAWFHELSDEREDRLLNGEWPEARGVNAHYGGFHGDLGIANGVMDVTGFNCVFNCTYLIALRCAATLADAIGRTTDQADLEQRIAVLERSIRQIFWDSERGCYSDNEKRTTYSPHASLFAVRAGVAMPNQLEPIRQHVRTSLQSLFVNGFGPEQGVRVSPSFSFYIFEGLYALGLADTAETMMRQGWGWFLQRGLRQTPEYFNLNISMCHAWSACPAFFLSSHVLGVQLPAGPDAGDVVIRVTTSSVTSAEGTFPHPLGDIHVKWHTNPEGKRIFDEVQVPEGLRAVVMDS